MTVIPIRTALLDFEAIGEGLARRDSGKAQARHAVHVARDHEAVPVDRAGLGQAIRDVDHHVLAFVEAQKRPWNQAVNGHGRAFAAGEVHGPLFEDQVVFVRQGGRGAQARKDQSAERAMERHVRLHRSRSSGNLP